MGMYDTLLIPFENETLELQSKRFDCILQTYTQGDVVSGAGSGIQIFYDEVDLDDTGKQCNHNSPSSGTLTVFIILVDSVFLDSVLIEGKLQPDYILLKIEALKQKWMDNALIHQKLIQAIMTRQGTVQILRTKIECALYAIRESRRLRNQPEPENRIVALFLSDETKRLMAGEDVMDVVESCLKNPQPLLFQPDIQLNTDPLQAYRL